MKRVLLFSFAFLISVLIYSQELKSEQDFKDYFKKNISKLDPIEGIWNETFTKITYDIEQNIKNDNFKRESKVVIIKEKDKFIICSIEGKTNLKFNITFTKTEEAKNYLADITIESYGYYSSVANLYNDSILDFEYEIKGHNKMDMIKESDPEMEIKDLDHLYSIFKCYHNFEFTKLYPTREIIKEEKEKNKGSIRKR